MLARCGAPGRPATHCRDWLRLYDCAPGEVDAAEPPARCRRRAKRDAAKRAASGVMPIFGLVGAGLLLLTARRVQRGKVN